MNLNFDGKFEAFFPQWRFQSTRARLCSINQQLLGGLVMLDSRDRSVDSYLNNVDRTVKYGTISKVSSIFEAYFKMH